jgi:hypothetical protein
MVMDFTDLSIRCAMSIGIAFMCREGIKECYHSPKLDTLILLLFLIFSPFIAKWMPIDDNHDTYYRRD